MNDDHALNLVYLVLILAFVIGSLAARRVRFGAVLRALLIWAVIGAVVFVGVRYRSRISTALNDVADRVGLSDQSTQGGVVRISKSEDGHFWARARLNGVERSLLIDSGATTTSLSEATAKEAGIPVSRGDYPVLVDTANGAVAAYRATIARVSVGPLRTDGLDALVSANFGETDVLGMNFLSRLKSWRVEGDTLVLEPRHKRRPSEE